MKLLKIITLLFVLLGTGYCLEAREYHVSLNGSDLNDGSVSKPLKTIAQAARIAKAGDVVTVHEGTYREYVIPENGGTDETHRIVYQAAHGEKVSIKGSEIIKGWQPIKDDVWKVTIPNTFFGKFNPYQDTIWGDWFGNKGRIHHTGEVYLNGKSFYEVEALAKVINPKPLTDAVDSAGSTYTWYCESNNKTTTIWANFHGHKPNAELVEINARPACFFPTKTGLNYITLRGFTISQAATQWAAPTAEQIGMIGPHWSKGWIIENNVISDSKCSGISLGKEKTANMNAIIGDPDRLHALAEDFVKHYEERVSEGATIKGKAMVVCSTREIAYELYRNVIALRPQWNEVLVAEEGVLLSEKDKKEIKPMERIKMIMTRGQDDDETFYKLLGTKDYRKELDRQFKNEKSNFKIAIVVDMWLTGFDVPFLDTMYIDKPIQQHDLIQTISRVNRKFEGKNKGLVVDYIGIKKQMNLALAKYNKGDKDNFEDIAESVIIVRNHLDLLAKLFHKFDDSKYFHGTNIQQLNTLNMAAEFAQKTKEIETRFMGLVKRLKAAYDICAGSEQLTHLERDYTHFYLAVRSIVFKLTNGNAPDIDQMNARVREMIKDALESDGVQEIFKLGDENETEQDLFDEDYLSKIAKIKLPNTKIKLLQQLLAKVIAEIKKVNKVKGVDFTRKMQVLVERYNQRDESDVLRSEVYEEMAEQLTNLIWEVHREFSAGDLLGIDFEEKAFYDILKELCVKYDFSYPEDKLIELAKAVKDLVEGQAKFPDWNKRDDIKSALKVGLILLLDEFGYPPVERDEVYLEIFEQAENFKKNQAV